MANELFRFITGFYLKDDWFQCRYKKSVSGCGEMHVLGFGRPIEFLMTGCARKPGCVFCWGSWKIHFLDELHPFFKGGYFCASMPGFFKCWEVFCGQVFFAGCLARFYHCGNHQSWLSTSFFKICFDCFEALFSWDKRSDGFWKKMFCEGRKASHVWPLRNEQLSTLMIFGTIY